MLTRAERGMLAGFVGAVLGVSAGLLLLFAAWGRLTDPNAGRDPNRVRIVFTGWGGIVERDVFTRLVHTFVQRNPDVEVEYRPIPRDYVTKLKLMFAGGTPPDVFYLPDGDFPGFASQGRVVNLQPYVDRSRVIREAEMWDSGLRRYRFDGKVFGRGPLLALPKDIGPTAMFVNRDLLRAAGVPVPAADRPLTWDEAVALWKPLTRDLDGDGRIDQWGTHGITVEAAVWSHGGDFVSADGRTLTAPDDPRTVEALRWVVGLQSELHVAPMERQQKSIPVDVMFLTGRMATFIGGRWMVPQFRNAGFDWDVLPVPVSPVTRQPAGWSGSVGLAIAPGSRHPDAAWRLIEFLSGPEGQAVQARTGFQVPNQLSLSRTEVFLQPGQRPEHAEVFLLGARTQQAGPPSRTPDNQWWDLFIRSLAPAYRGEKPVEQCLRDSRAEVQAALDRAWKGLERR